MAILQKSCSFCTSTGLDAKPIHSTWLLWEHVSSFTPPPPNPLPHTLAWPLNSTENLLLCWKGRNQHGDSICPLGGSPQFSDDRITNLIYAPSPLGCLEDKSPIELTIASLKVPSSHLESDKLLTELCTTMQCLFSSLHSSSTRAFPASVIAMALTRSYLRLKLT